MQERIDEAGDLGRHRRREEQRLPGERHQFADPLDVRNEAHVEHAVGFVDHQNFDAGQQQLAAIGKVEQPPRRRDQHVGAASDFRFLIAERHAADQQREIELVIDAVFGEGFLDLRGQFARRLEDQRARHARAGAALFEPRQHRQREGGGLAGAGLGDSEHVAPFEGVGDGLFLDWRRRVVSRQFDGFEHFLAQAEFIELHSVLPRWGA